MNEVTELLRRAAQGDASAQEPLYRLLYPTLMQLARSHMRRVGTISLDASGLLHEAYLRLSQTDDLPNHNRNVFFAYASRVMHSVIVDYVREKGAQKRGGNLHQVTLSNNIAEHAFSEHAIADIDRAMRALERVDERAFRVVQMRYFGGLNEEEVAAALEISLATVKRDWRKARVFLFGELS
jgi:RNA polymerase sigma factor (TIGR02999 family)